MKPQIKVLSFLLTFLGLSLVTSASSEILVPKFIVSTNALYPASIQQEVHLARSLFVEENKTFDDTLYRSLGVAIKPPFTVSFHLVSFVFSYPSTDDCLPSQCELSQPHELVCTNENISRRSGSTNEIPVNYVRIVNRQKTNPAAELHLLVSVTPQNALEDVRYIRRTFQFVYRDGWKEEK